jgi:Uma2 family endonuclease
VRAERDVKTPKYFEGAPDVAIEVVSPTDLHTEVEAKSAEWLRAGTRAVVVVDHVRKTARIDRPDGSGDVTEAIALDDILPGWRLPLAELFE